MRRHIQPLVATALLVIGTTACQHASRYDDPVEYRFDYYYYPHVGVYYHLHSGRYYYRDGRTWVAIHRLPEHIYLDHQVRRKLIIREAKPYHRYAFHRERYPAPRDFRHDRRHDRAEREHNRREHRLYNRH
jgi:hypothetical protein